MTNAAIEYHQKVKRGYKVVVSDKRRCYMKCSLDHCSFDLKFSVGKGIITSSKAHDMEERRVPTGKQRNSRRQLRMNWNQTN
jgi:hypothetical protein